MKAWHFVAALLALTLLFRAGPATPVLTAADVDAIASGDVVAHALSDDGDLREAFRAPKEHPRAKILRRGTRPDRHRRANLVSAPLPTWVAALGALTTSYDELAGLRWTAALLFALAGLIVFTFVIPPSQGTRGWFVAFCLVTPLSFDIALGSVAGATAAFAMSLLLWSLRALQKGHSPLWVGGAWGLCLASHPATIWLIIPVFIVAARALPTETQAGAGQLPLPRVPLTLLAVPGVGLMVLVLVWPALWQDTGMGIFTWLTDSWRESVPGHVVAGTGFEQAHDRAPLAWISLLQGAALVPVTLLLAMVGGVWHATDSRRRGDWLAILVAATLLLAGGLNGGLFHSRLSLSGHLLFPMLLIAGAGARFLTERAGLTASRGAALFCVPALLQLLALGPVWTAPNGAELQRPVPVALLAQLRAASEELGDDQALTLTLAGGDTLAPSTRDVWKHAIWRAGKAARLNVALRDAQDADWLLVLDAEPLHTPADAVDLIPPNPPDFSTHVTGVRWDAYRLRRPTGTD